MDGPRKALPEINPDRCTGCGWCVAVCPPHVLSFGGFLGMGEKLFAVPWSALVLDTKNKRFVLDVDKERLENAPGFDANDWPDMANDAWEKTVNDYYGTQPRSAPRQ